MRKLEIYIDREYDSVRCFLDSQYYSSFRISRLLTETYLEDGYGIFNKGFDDVFYFTEGDREKSKGVFISFDDDLYTAPDFKASLLKRIEKVKAAKEDCKSHSEKNEELPTFEKIEMEVDL